MICRWARTFAECERASALFPSLRQQGLAQGAEIYLGFVERPVERIVAASVLTPLGAIDGVEAASFAWSILPERLVNGDGVTFLGQMAAEASQRDWPRLVTKAMVTEDCPTEGVLLAAGFRRYQENLVFQVAAPAFCQRTLSATERLLARGSQHSWRVLAPTKADYAAVSAFLQPHGFIEQPLFAEGLAAGAFREFSGVLWVDDQVRGVFLVQRESDDALRAPVFVVEGDARLSAARAASVMCDYLVRRPGAEKIQTVQFRTQPGKSPAMVRFAQRNGATLLGRLWSHERIG